MHQITIDTTSTSKAELIKRLAAQPFTISVTDGGEYQQDKTLSQVHLVSKVGEQAVEDWLYEEKGIDYIGVAEKQ